MPTINRRPSPIQTAVVAVSSAQILALGATPVALVPAQGAGTVIVPVGLGAKLTFVTTAYTSAGGAVDIGIASGGDNTNNVLYTLSNGFMTAAASQVAINPILNGGSFTATTFENVRLAMTLGGAAFTLGDGTLTVSVAYYVAPI